MLVASYRKPHGFGEIRAFTPEEVQRVQEELDRVSRTIAQKSLDYALSSANPLNYVTEVQRDRISAMSRALDQDKGIYSQLQSSRDETIESGDTDKLQRWLDLAASVGSPGDMQTWNESKAYASTANMIETVGAQTAAQIASPFGVPWWVWALGLGVGYIAITRRR